MEFVSFRFYSGNSNIFNVSFILGGIMTQQTLIREHLERGSITPLEALRLYSCFRLASVVNRLRSEGMDIITNIKEDYETKSKYAEYHIRKVRNNG